ncbi:MAG: PEP-CTERM sorting domain-containing protein [Phycisphaerae bacterium]|nr:PEP-CTERM sorting domain-containing protein [Phycisphaerae bacterium]
MRVEKHSHSGKHWLLLLAAAMVACGMATTTSAAETGAAVYVWGNGGYSQLGWNNVPTSDRWMPVVVPTLEQGVTAIAAADRCSFAIQNGSLYAWGDNSYGMLGLGTSGDYSHYSPQFVSANGAWTNSGVTAAAVGTWNGFAIQGGSLYVWGSDILGSSGLGGTVTFAPQPMSTGGEGWTNSGVTAIAAGDRYSLAIQNGAVYAWGFSVASTPQPVSTGGEGWTNSGVTSIAAGHVHSLAIQDGTLYAWGANFYGCLGLGLEDQGIQATPQPVSFPGAEGNVTAIAAGGTSSMAVVDGQVYVWGYGYDSTPQKVDGLANIVNVAIGGNDNTLHPSFYALDAEGVLWAWGHNNSGQLGVEFGLGTSTFIATPQRVGAGMGANGEDLTSASISAGNGIVMAIQGVPVPEPVSLLLLSAGAAGLLSRRRK